MSNHIENENRHEFHWMTQFTQRALSVRLLDLQEELRFHQQEMGEAAGSQGDYHDNFGFEEASRQVDIVSRMISELRDRLYNVKIIEPRQEVDIVGLGNGVIVQFAGEDGDEIFTVLGPDDATQKSEWISYKSPLGSMLLGKQAGDRIDYQISNGSPQQVTVKAILSGSF